MREELYLPVVLDILAAAQWDEEDSCRKSDVCKETEAVTLVFQKSGRREVASSLDVL
jgi:hypothetical protein